MTRDKKFKKLVRSRAAESGERYTASRAALRKQGSSPEPLRRRIVGLETKYTVVDDGARPLAPTEAAELVMREVIPWARSTNAYLENGANLKLFVGSLDYATPECDSPGQLQHAEQAGDEVVGDLVRQASGISGRELWLSKAQTQHSLRAGGCHENYLLRKQLDLGQTIDNLVPFLITRLVWSAAGGFIDGRFVLSARVSHLDRVAGKTSREDRTTVIDTGARPFADEGEYQRLHVTFGDANSLAELTCLKVATTHLVLRLIETGCAELEDLRLRDPIHTLRSVNEDLELKFPVSTRSAAMTAIDVQRSYVDLVSRDLVETLDEGDVAVLEAWSEHLDALESGATERFEWMRKREALDGVGPADLERRELEFHRVERPAVHDLVRSAPSSTRARLREEFIRSARKHERAYTVDWLHLKLNDEAQRTVICKDPFDPNNARVRRLLSHVGRS